MMGHRDKLKTGMEYDVIFARKMYCYLQNIPSLVRYVKRSINKRTRAESKEQVKKIMQTSDEYYGLKE